MRCALVLSALIAMVCPVAAEARYLHLEAAQRAALIDGRHLAEGQVLPGVCVRATSRRAWCVRHFLEWADNDALTFHEQVEVTAAPGPRGAISVRSLMFEPLPRDERAPVLTP